MNPYLTPNPFSNPIYGNYGQMPFQQPMQQQMQPIGIAGRYVNDFNEINVSEIPMSSPAIFIKNDKSEIQVREWNANGQINHIVYKPYIEPIAQETQKPTFDYKTDLIDPLFERISQLEQQISKISVNKPVAQKKVSE